MFNTCQVCQLGGQMNCCETDSEKIQLSERFRIKKTRNKDTFKGIQPN